MTYLIRARIAFEPDMPKILKERFSWCPLNCSNTKFVIRLHFLFVSIVVCFEADRDDGSMENCLELPSAVVFGKAEHIRHKTRLDLSGRSSS